MWSRMSSCVAALTLLSTAASFKCFTDVDLGDARSADRKGIAVDDFTLEGCPNKVPEFWPNTDTPVKSLRLFKVWDAKWDPNSRHFAWSQLLTYLRTQNATVLVGTPVTCNQAADDKDWAYVKEFLKLLGPEHVMGVAVGNELDILHLMPGVPSGCAEELWTGGRYWRTFQSRISELEDIGLGSVPVTSVMTGSIFWGNHTPFLESDDCRANSFLENASTTYGERFVFTFNLYPYFNDRYKMDAGSSDKCTGALASAVSFGAGGFVPGQVAIARKRMRQLGGVAGSSLLWVGETGWSSERAGSLSGPMVACKAWSSVQSFRKVYENFLEWDIGTEANNTPDHAFYFTMRDALNFGSREHFGLVNSCWEPVCKVASEGFEAPSWAERGEALPQVNWVFFLLGLGVLALAALSYCVTASTSGSAPVEPVDP